MTGRMLSLAAAAFVSAAALSGCRFVPSPYDQTENWLICDSAVRQFVVPADVIYVQSGLYVNAANVPLMYSYAKSEVGNGKFNRIARVFSPLIATPQDIARALKWYFWHHHERGRPFVFIGEGIGGRLLHDYEKTNEDSLKADGLVASFYTDNAHKGFVTEEMVKEICRAIHKTKYRTTWGREMPKGMLDK